MSLGFVFIDKRPEGYSGAIARARDGAWDTTEAAAAGLGRIAAQTWLSVSLLGKANPPAPDVSKPLAETLQSMDITDWSWGADPSSIAWHTESHRHAAECLLSTFTALVPRADLWAFVGANEGKTIVCSASPGDAGAVQIGVLVLAGIAIVAGCAAVAYVGAKGMQVIDRELSRRDEAKKLVATHTSALRLVAEHRKAELEAGGSPIPYSEAETRVLDQLLSDASELARRRDAPLAVPGDDLKTPNLPSMGLDLGAGAILVIALGAWLLLK